MHQIPRIALRSVRSAGQLVPSCRGTSFGRIATLRTRSCEVGSSRIELPVEPQPDGRIRQEVRAQPRYHGNCFSLGWQDFQSFLFKTSKGSHLPPHASIWCVPEFLIGGELGDGVQSSLREAENAPDDEEIHRLGVRGLPKARMECAFGVSSSTVNRTSSRANAKAEIDRNGGGFAV